MEKDVEVQVYNGVYMHNPTQQLMVVELGEVKGLGKAIKTIGFNNSNEECVRLLLVGDSECARLAMLLDNSEYLGEL